MHTTFVIATGLVVYKNFEPNTTFIKLLQKK